MKLRSTFSAVRAALLVVLSLTLASCNLLDSALEIDPAVAPENQTEATRTAEDFETVRSRDPQAAIGAKGHPKILAAHGGTYQDAKLENLLAVIAGKLVTQTKEPDRAYNITVLDSPAINAFALPGGYLYVTRGLLALANDASEVAAVLAHEMAHVSSNHGLQRNRQAKAADIAADVVSNVVSNPVIGEVAKATTKQKLASFSQRQELQADAVGIKLVASSGYDAFGASRFLDSMDSYSAWRSSLAAGEADMASSHPSTPQRIELARRHARIAGMPGSGKKDRDRFLAGIDGMIFGETAREGFVRGNNYAHAKLGIAFSVPENFDLTNRRDAVIASGPNEQALRFDAVPIAGTPEATDDYLMSGWVNGLDPATVTKGTINGFPSAIGQAQAGDWRFAITVINFNKRHYRFILAAPRFHEGVATRGQAIASTFRKLSKADRAKLKPLRLRVVTVRSGDTVQSLATKMTGVRRSTDLFRTLNGLGKDARLTPGQKVKIVSSG